MRLSSERQRHFRDHAGASKTFSRLEWQSRFSQPPQTTHIPPLLPLGAGTLWGLAQAYIKPNLCKMLLG